MTPPSPHARRSWPAKFRDAFRGVAQAVRGERSFRVHLIFAFAAIAAGGWLGLSGGEWAVLALCIASVLTAEAFNSALEQLARAAAEGPDPRVGRALDMASGAVLLASLGSVAVGLALFGPKLLEVLARL